METEARELLEKQLLLKNMLLERREGDPLHGFEPFGVQKRFIRSVIQGECRENYYIGANRSGKSDAGAYAGAAFARFGDQSDAIRWIGAKGSDLEVRDRATSGWVSAVDFPTSRDVIQPKYFDNGFLPPNRTHEPFIPKHEIAPNGWRVSDQTLKLRNGSIIGFKSADSGRAKYQGAEKDWVHLDEEHPETIYDEITIRVGAKPLKIFTTCTLLPPEGLIGGITWIYNKIVKPWKAGYLERVQVFNASIYDNPHIPLEEIAILEARYPEGSVNRRIRLDGDLIGGLMGSRVYSGFDPKLNVRPQGPVASRRPIAWLWDFNVEPMVTLVGQRQSGLFRVHKELILEEGNIQEMCELFRAFYPTHRAEVVIYGDASGKDRSHQTKRTSYQVISNCMKDYPVPVRQRVPETNPPVASRINAVNTACRNHEGEIMLEVDPSCEELLSDLEQVISDGKGGIKKSHNKKDPYYRRTHFSDALGYWIAFEAPVRPIDLTPRAQESRRVARPGYGSH